MGVTILVVGHRRGHLGYKQAGQGGALGKVYWVHIEVGPHLLTVLAAVWHNVFEHNRAAVPAPCLSAQLTVGRAGLKLCSCLN
jgi:hypothetical protein